jgi:preprotein translocase subunit Sec61beta
MPISTPQQQAGVLSFYDAPEKGPVMNVRLFLIGVAIFVIIIIIFDHAALFT